MMPALTVRCATSVQDRNLDRASRLPKDGVGTASTPNNVRLVSSNCRSILESGPPIVGPGHLKDPLSTLDALRSQAFTKLSFLDVCDKGRDRASELCLLRRRQPPEVLLEALGCRPG